MLRWLAACVATLAAMTSAAAAQTPTALVFSFWYRGSPPGVVRAEDVETIRDLGFAAVTWPYRGSPGTTMLIGLADAAGLKVVFREMPAPIGPASVVEHRDTVDIDLSAVPSTVIRPLVWRAVAHGARVISFDPGARSLAPASARSAAWLPVVVDLGRQLRANGQLFGESRDGPNVTFETPPAPGVDVALRDAGKAWIVIATNVSSKQVRVSARLPATVPYAMWLSLLDGSTLAMLEDAAGPKWLFDLDARGVRVHVIDKGLK